MSGDQYSDEVFVRMIIEFDHIEQMEVFSYTFRPEKCDRLTDDEWVKEHINNCLMVEDLRKMLNIQDEGIYQVLMKVKLHGWYSGWETPEWDEELDIREYQVRKMPDDWFGEPEVS